MPRIDDQPGTVHATSPRSRRSPGRRILRIAGWGAAGLTSLAVVAVGTTAVLDAIDRRQVPAPGELVELDDGRLLHLHVLPGPDDRVLAAADDRPTVVLEAGSGGSAATMAWLHRELAEHATVVAYDRAGYGFSDASDGDMNADSVVTDLHDALGVLGRHGPYILVGHSLGGGYVRAFAAAHIDEVAALVLLDPVHEEQLDRLPPESIAALEQAQQQLAVAPALARLGVFRLTDPQAAIIASLPEDAGEQHRARSITAGGMRAYGREVAVLPELLAEIGRVEDIAPQGAASREAFGGVPVTVVSADEPAEGETPHGREVMDALHRELVERSPAASHVVIEGSDHLSLVFDAVYAREVAAIIVGLLDELAESGAAARAE